MGLSEKELKILEKILLEERHRVLKELNYYYNTISKEQREIFGDNINYSTHPADVGTDASERDKTFLFATTEGRYLLEIDDALRRMYRKEYGYCEECDELIAFERLKAVPFTCHCIECRRKIEEEERREKNSESRNYRIW